MDKMLEDIKRQLQIAILTASKERDKTYPKDLFEVGGVIQGLYLAIEIVESMKNTDEDETTTMKKHDTWHL